MLAAVEDSVEVAGFAAAVAAEPAVVLAAEPAVAVAQLDSAAAAPVAFGPAGEPVAEPAYELAVDVGQRQLLLDLEEPVSGAEKSRVVEKLAALEPR